MSDRQSPDAMDTWTRDELSHVVSAAHGLLLRWRRRGDLRADLEILARAMGPTEQWTAALLREATEANLCPCCKVRTLSPGIKDGWCVECAADKVTHRDSARERYELWREHFANALTGTAADPYAPSDMVRKAGQIADEATQIEIDREAKT